jgi:hypothetical protein
MPFQEPVMRLLFCCLLAALPSADDELDPALVGTWQTVVKNEAGEWKLTLKLEASGAYRTTIAGPAALPDETGKFAGLNGKCTARCCPECRPS